MALELKKIITLAENFEAFNLNDFSYTFLPNKFYLVKGLDRYTNSLLKVIGLINLPISGEYYFDNQNLLELKKKELNKFKNQNFGYLFAKPYLDDFLTVKENIALPIKPKNKKEIATGILSNYDMLAYQNKYPLKLNDFEKQKVSLIRAIVNKPKYLLIFNTLDELENNQIEELLTIFKQLLKEGITIIMSTNKDIFDANVDIVINITKDGLDDN